MTGRVQAGLMEGKCGSTKGDFFQVSPGNKADGVYSEKGRSYSALPLTLSAFVLLLKQGSFKHPAHTIIVRTEISEDLGVSPQNSSLYNG